MTSKIISFCIALAILLVTPTYPSEAADLKQGEQIFNAICSACHARGGNVMMGNKTLQKEALEKYGMASAEKIIIQVTQGKNAMPAFGGRLKRQQIEDVSAYVLAQAEKGWRTK